jgi:hypothetical protein
MEINGRRLRCRPRTRRIDQVKREENTRLEDVHEMQEWADRDSYEKSTQKCGNEIRKRKQKLKSYEKYFYCLQTI